MKILKIEDKNYPKKLRKIKKPPEKIYVEGNIEILNNFGIAIIGSRNCTEYGKKMAIKFSEELSNYNINIISGMAKGIDSFAHKACIENKGKTIAVLPSGFNNIFPKENEKLFKSIIDSGGTVISEYEPNTKKSYEKFLERNRIVCGLACATLVVEAGHRSGTTVTARYTKEQDKNVFCIPSSLENIKGIGTNNLIKQGAKLVTCVEDILEEYKHINFKKKIKENNSKIKEKNNLIPSDYIDIYNILTKKPTHINDIFKNSKLDIKEINYKLMMLELGDYITQLPGKYFIRK